jgi:inosine-uridine nucleoside N-ribohydrolase
MGTAQEKQPILWDTDIGSDVEDSFALALILASPELELRGVSTVSGDTQVRALMACRFLTMTGRRHTAVAAGMAPQPKGEISPTGLYRYYYHPDVLFNRTTRPVKESAVDFLYSKLKAQQGKITLVAAGPLTNIARLISEKPECKPWIRKIVFPMDEATVRSDVKATQAVFASDIPILVLPRHLTDILTLDQGGLERVFLPGTALSLQVQAMFQLWDKETPGLTDALAVALCLDEGFCQWKETRLELDDKANLRMAKDQANARVATAVDRDRFVKWYIDRLSGCVPPSRQPAKLLATGGMPNRVHVAEDYELDIERFWWMSGKAETKNLPPGSKRACRGTLTHDFDDLLGHTKAMYTAVIFNPVPGPPMGKNPRLSFRYWLKGTDTVRVQISSWTNGYHRHLVLTGLPQGQWESGTVDMTVARRPDGTGGPLSENERIDDIQFYVEPTAEILIDDVVLFDAALPGEKRPFPKHIHYSALFDTGQQEKHWPGTYELVADQGYFWRAARAVDSKELGVPWIRLHMRGERPLGKATRLSFRYRLTGADNVRALLVNSKTKGQEAAEVKNLKRDQWAEATVDFGRTKGNRVDEIHFLLPRGAEMLVDDVLLYEPSSGGGQP